MLQHHRIGVVYLILHQQNRTRQHRSGILVLRRLNSHTELLILRQIMLHHHAMCRSKEGNDRTNLLHIKQLQIILLLGFVLRHKLLRGFALGFGEQFLTLNNLERVQTLHGIRLHLTCHNIANNGYVLRLHA